MKSQPSWRRHLFFVIQVTEGYTVPSLPPFGAPVEPNGIIAGARKKKWNPQLKFQTGPPPLDFIFKGVPIVGCYATGQGWVGGMITFLALAHMLDAAQLVGWVGGGDDHIPCTCTHVGCCATGQGWVGGGWSHFLHLHTCWMLRNWSGMIAFLALAHTLDATQLVGDDHISCTCTHVGCYATGRGWSHFLHLHTCWMLRNWSGMITFLAPAHTLDATQLVGDDHISCTCTHVGCYATGRGWSHSLHLHTRWMLRNWWGMITFLALAHMLDAAQLVGDDHISCTCTHVGCYATGRGWSHFLHLHTCWMLRNWSGMITFLALAHTLDATQLVGDDHISCTCTHVGCYATGRGWSHFCTCTHVGCYATGRGWSHFLHLHTCWMLRNWSGMITFLALAHTLDATQLVGDDHLHLHKCWMLRNWSGMITFLALAHMLDATQLVGDDHISCTCTHVGCYATGGGWSHFLHLHLYLPKHSRPLCDFWHEWNSAVSYLTSNFQRKCPTAPLLLQGMKTCQIQLVSDFVKTPKVLVSPRRNANFSTSACKSRVKQWKNRMEPIPIGRNT